MAEIHVNPTRMELKKLKARLSTARRGHKLLKDKRDELMKQFLDVVREDKDLREDVERSIRAAFVSFSVAAAVSNPKQLREALALPKREGVLRVRERNRMSVIVPEFKMEFGGDAKDGGGCFGYAFTSGELDASLAELGGLTDRMIRLAELEKSAQMLAQEIEKTRRRVNALEYIMIPDLERAIKSIAMKLDENERGNQTRLMKVKDMMVEAQRKKA